MMKMIGDIVADHIREDQTNYRRAQEIRRLRPLVQRRMRLDIGGAEANQEEARAAQEDLDNLNAEWQTVTARVNPLFPMYVPANFHVSLESMSNDFRVYYNYMTTDIYYDDITRMHVQTHPSPNGNRHPGQVARLQYIARLLDYTVDWPSCAFANSPLGLACKAPNKYNRVDVALVYHVDPRTVPGNHPWQIPLFVIEIKGKTEDPQGIHGPFAQVAHAASQMLVFLPVAFAMVVRAQDVIIYEFKRDPNRSYINVYQKSYPFNGVDSSIGQQMSDIVEVILKCVVKSLVGNVVRCLPGLRNLDAQGYHPTPEQDEEKDKPCPDCFHIKDLASLDNFMTQFPGI